MGITAISGPHLVYGITQSSSGTVTEYNEERGPSLYDLGAGLADPRVAYSYDPGSPVGTKIYGWIRQTAYVDVIPTTKSTNSIAQAQAPVAGSNLTLTASNTTNVTVGVSITAPESGQTVAGLLAIDGAGGGLSFGSGGTVNIWDPTKALSRQVVIYLSSNLDGGNFTIAGRDVYGYKVTEQLAAGSSTLTSQKTYKYIYAISASTTITSTGVTIGVNDTYGLPLRADDPLWVNVLAGRSSLATPPAVPGAVITFASTVTATSTTADVRGTYVSSVASSTANAVRFMCAVTPSPQNLATVTASDVSGIVGVTQYSSY